MFRSIVNWVRRTFGLGRHIGPTEVFWKPGDLAECICDDWPHVSKDSPKLGEKLMVSRVKYGPLYPSGNLAFALGFVGKKRLYHAVAFRKIVAGGDKADRKIPKKAPVTQKYYRIDFIN